MLALVAWGIVVAGDRLAALVRRDARRADLAGGALAATAVVWLLLMTSSSVTWTGWEDEIANFTRKPMANAWEEKPGLIPRFGIMRGTSYWVSYADGYLLALRGYEEDPAAWSAIHDRPMEQWGKIAGLRVREGENDS